MAGKREFESQQEQMQSKKQEKSKKRLLARYRGRKPCEESEKGR